MKNIIQMNLSTKARLKMAYLPSKATLIDNPVSNAPGFSLIMSMFFQEYPKFFEIMFKEFIKGIAKLTTKNL